MEIFDSLIWPSDIFNNIIQLIMNSTLLLRALGQYRML